MLAEWDKNELYNRHIFKLIYIYRENFVYCYIFYTKEKPRWHLFPFFKIRLKYMKRIVNFAGLVCK